MNITVQIDYAQQTPTFDSDGDPTEETLKWIETWRPDKCVSGQDGWSNFIEFCREAWNLDFGTIREEQEDGKKVLCFVTGGWSANDAVQAAMNRNTLFHLLFWQSSHRGGLVKYAFQ